MLAKRSHQVAMLQRGSQRLYIGVRFMAGEASTLSKSHFQI